MTGKTKSIDTCIARGCGGLLGGVEREVFDGSTAHCGRCGREHTFHVAHDGAIPNVTIERIDYRGRARERRMRISAARDAVIAAARGGVREAIRAAVRALDEAEATK